VALNPESIARPFSLESRRMKAHWRFICRTLCQPAIIALTLLLILAASSALAASDHFPDTVFAHGFEPCSGLECAQVQCPSAGTTSVSGVVYAPNGTLVLPNVLVYVPNTAVGSLPSGAQCNHCNTAPSGHPLVATLTAADGSFTLENMPVTADVPLVILAGKWRSQIPINTVPGCVDTPLAAAMTRLPRNKSEGDMPLIALSTGGADSLECLLRKAGIDDTEFSTNSGGGRVHLYAGFGGTDRFDAAHGGAAFASSTTLWSSSASLAPYDLVLLACEGQQDALDKPQSSLDAMKSYADAGGRVYAGHWQNYWIFAGPTPWPSLATWNFALPNLDSLVADVNAGFDQGNMFSQWLLTTGASVSPGTISIEQGRQTAITVDESLTRKWIYKDQTTNFSPTVQYFSFTTPVEATPSLQCGRVVFTDMHPAGGDLSHSGLQFPSGGCANPINPLNAQEKALLYAFFDLGRCTDGSRQ
jgi:hypothetical protein